MALKTYKGSCHCGRIEYTADIDLAQGTGKCNCTFCSKVRAWKAFVKPDAFHITGEDLTTPYRRHPQASLKYFCKVCGVYTHERGNADYMGGDFVGIFLATLDNVSQDELAAASVRYSDGLHNNWGNPPADIRNL